MLFESIFEYFSKVSVPVKDQTAAVGTRAVMERQPEGKRQTEADRRRGELT